MNKADILPFLRRRRERYLIVEFFSGGERALSFYLSRDRKLIFHKEWQNFSIPRFVRRRKWLREGGDLSIIAVVNDSDAVTVEIPVHLERTKIHGPLSLSELENGLRLTVAQAFNEERSAASRALKASELDTVLIGSRVYGFDADGYSVISPVGLPVRRIQAMVELLFTRRELYDRLRPLFERREDVYFTERGTTLLNALKNTYIPPYSFVLLNEESSPYFILTSKDGRYAIERGHLAWRTSRILQTICDSWKVSYKTAIAIYGRYRNQGLSPKASGYLKRLFKAEEMALLSEFRRTKFEGPVFVESDLELPFALTGRRGGRTFKDPPLLAVLAKMGCEIDPVLWHVPDHELFMRLAPFIEQYHQKDDLPINRWLRHRLQWLGAPVTKSGERVGEW